MTHPALVYRIGLWAIVLLGAWLRLSTIGRDSAWVDEVLSISYASGSPLDVLGQLEPQHMPLYFLITSVMLWFSDAEVWLRLPSAAFGIAILPLLYKIGVEAGRPRVGLVAAGLAAVSGYLVAYSQEIRMYCLVAFLAVLGTWAVIRVIRDPDPQGTRRGWIVLVVASILNLYSSPFASLMVAAHWTVVGVVALRRHQLRRWTLCLLGMAVAYVPAILHMLPVVTGDADVVQQPQRQYDQLFTLLRFTAGHFAGLVLSLRWVLPIVAAAGALIAVVDRRYRSPAMAAIAVVCFALPLVALHLAKPAHFFNPRYLIYAQPHMLLMVAVTLVFVWDHTFGLLGRWMKTGVAEGLGALAPLGLGVAALLIAAAMDPDHEMLGRKANWRGMARVLLDNLQPGDTVMVAPPWRDNSLLYALDREAEAGARLQLEPQSNASSYRDLRRWRLEEGNPEDYGGPVFHLMGINNVPELITYSRDLSGRVWFIASQPARILRALRYQTLYAMPGIHSYSGGRTRTESMPTLSVRR